MDPQSMKEQAAPASGGRLLLWLVCLFAASVLLGALLAPPIFNLALRLGRNFQFLESLRDVEFERVASRTVLIVLLLSFAPALKLAGMRNWYSIGFPPDDNWWKTLGKGLLIGGAATAVIFLEGWALGAYGVRETMKHGAIEKSMVYFVGALFVGVIEECLFRGALFGALRQSIGFGGGAAISSLIYSAVHFAKPRPPVGVVYGHWHSGLDLIPYMFNTVDLSPHCFPLALTLFFLGMVLCAFYQRYGSLYFSIGLHAGLVWLMRIGGYFFERNEARLLWLFGDSEVVSKSYIALFVLTAFLAVSLWLARNRFRDRGEAVS
jgi:hypothetical protein